MIKEYLFKARKADDWHQWIYGTPIYAHRGEAPRMFCSKFYYGDETGIFLIQPDTLQVVSDEERAELDEV